MKKFLRTLLPICLMLICIAAFSSCSDTGTTPTNLSGVEIAFNTLTLTGTSTYDVFPNATETFSFLNEVTVAQGATYKVAVDEYGRDIFHAKTVPLEEGDNAFYIIVENGNDTGVYTVTLRRRPMYTVTVDKADGTTPTTQKVEEGKTATIATPSRAGINFLGWNADITVPIVRDMTFIAKWDYSNLDDIYIFTYFNSGSGRVISGLTKEGEAYLQSNGGHLLIPASIDGVAVTYISTHAFYNCTGLTSVTFAEGSRCTYIGNDVFSGCTRLASITIPESVTYIDRNAFSHCTKLTSITIPESVTTIGPGAFSGCTKLTSITIPESVVYIGDEAFSGCTGLTSITLPFIGETKDGTSNTHFGYIFGASSSSHNNSYVPASLKTVVITGGTSIGSNAFCNCSGLTSVTIGDGVESIGGGAFEGCTGLTSIVIPDSVTSIGEEAFEWCTGLTSITVAEGNTIYHSEGNCIIETATKTLILGCKNSVIPQDGSVTSIGDGAFAGCTGLTSITIPDSVQVIGDYAFYGCTGLTSITIPDSVQVIYGSAFEWCMGLTSITVAQGNTVYHSEGNCLIMTESKTLILGCETSVIPKDGSVTSIGMFAFHGCTGLTSITIPDSVTSIGSNAFRDCTGLTSAIFENTTGWKAGSTSLSSTDLANTTTAATYLKSTYYDRTWTRN